ncbi:prolyl oligopeptidase family serine peptidase [Nostocaceae cyanobacterium CENA369]|uniref:Prolyl oligopeptidase family serine peptidase n=1 Tax=Dendronalium phyllosphericum CENA369 TaxID=1725256 RepID=A0A8J7LGZ7_9NOST|nr:prolyl oligopeptidase family serine peptidase [Dendronalium phyllosphericum]MBH8576851.1 prolyl oligopeptidase family serine peptidase [Dendronalium phyllosphericum CENA369]
MDSKQEKVTDTDTYNYLLFLPNVLRQNTSGQSNGTKQQLFPAIVFLHGAGERGSNLEDVKRQGLAKVVEEQPDFPFIVISPQCPLSKSWLVEKLSPLLDRAIASYPIARDRIYLTGLSMGGYGTWRWATAEPERFAAIAPICGGDNPLKASNLQNLPVWAFHGAQDRIVPLRESAIMVSALKAHGGNVKFTVYPEVGHDSWTQTYNNPELYEWFLQHRLHHPVG